MCEVLGALALLLRPLRVPAACAIGVIMVGPTYYHAVYTPVIQAAPAFVLTMRCIYLFLREGAATHPRAPTPATGRSNSALRLTRHRVKGLIVVNGSEPTGAPDPSSASPRAMYPVVPAHRPIVPTAVPALEGDSSPRPTCRNSRSIENSSQIHWNPVGRMTKLAAFFRGVCACGPALAR